MFAYKLRRDSGTSGSIHFLLRCNPSPIYSCSLVSPGQELHRTSPNFTTLADQWTPRPRNPAETSMISPAAELLGCKSSPIGHRDVAACGNKELSPAKTPRPNRSKCNKETLRTLGRQLSGCHSKILYQRKS